MNDSYLENDGAQASKNVALHLAGREAFAPARLDAFARTLADDELARWRRFQSREAAAQFLVGRGLLRAALSEQATVDPAVWRFAADAYGKPHVAAPAIGRDLRFNLSHTRDLVAVVVAEGFAVGVDVEEMRALDVAELAPLALSPAERDGLSRLAPDRRLERFYEIWTLKEAYAKAKGLGLSLPFPEIALETDGENWRLGGAAEDAGSWRLLALRPTARHRLAVAAEAANATIVVAAGSAQIAAAVADGGRRRSDGRTP